MKNIRRYKAILSVLVISVMMVGCLVESGEFADEFTKSAATIDIPGDQPYVYGDTEAINLEIDATKFSDPALIQSVTVVKSFAGELAGVSGLEQGSITSFPSTLSLSLADLLQGVGIEEADVAPGDTWTISYVVNLTDGRVLRPAGTTSISFSCASDLAGMYSVTTTYGYHDFLAYEPTNTMDVEIVAGATPGEYSVTDFSGGLYSVGLYNQVYGTSGFSVTFNEVCGSIVWNNQSDPWGPVVALDGGVNSVDSETGVITISWQCLAYGENGVSVYTPK